MEQLQELQRKVTGILTRIFAGKTPRVGLEIGDHAVRVLYEQGGKWQLEQVALPPGVVERGALVNKPVLLQALTELRKRAVGNTTKRAGVHVSLSSVPIYTQIVQIPRVKREELQEAVELNVQVSAPVPLAELAWGWQVLRPRDEGIDVLAAWTNEKVMDELITLLTQAGFLAATVEPKMLSVARVIRTLAPDTSVQQAFMIVFVDAQGITLAVLESGQVTFEYRLPWQDIQENAPEITVERINKVLRREVPQVASYYAQRAGKALNSVLLGTPSFSDEITTILKDMGFGVRTLAVGTPVFPLHGYASLGSALRGNIFAGDDRELTLLGGQIKEVLRRELVARIARFWSFALPLSLGLLVLTTMLTFRFVGDIRDSALIDGAAAAPAVLAELEARESRANRFNEVVGALYGIQQDLRPKSGQLARILDHARRTQVTIVRLSMSPSPASSSLGGVAQSEAQLLEFKRMLENDPTLQKVNLPIADIRPGPDGVTFSITFETDFPLSGNTSP